MTLSGMVQLMERIRNRSGVKGCKCHNFRRTFAITCLRNGMNIYVLAKLMGHADIAVLRRYLALVESDLEEATPLWCGRQPAGLSVICWGYSEELSYPSRTVATRGYESSPSGKAGRSQSS